MILANTYPYTGNGLGGLPDAIEAVVSHEINGIYELRFRYPVTGLHFDDLANGNIVMAEPDALTSAQPFRIYRITKPLNGVVTVYARHICYDMQGIICEPFTATDLTTAFQTIPTKLTPANSFNLSTTRTVATGMSIVEPRPLWKLLGGQAGSILDVYGGEWDFDGYDAKLVTQLGTDRGVRVAYGKNMTELEQDGTIEGTYSGVYPYWYDEESSTLVTIPEKFVTVAGAEVSDRVFVLDCSDDWDTAPSAQDLRDKANAYILANSVGNAKHSWKVSFADNPELMMDRVMLGDTMHVRYERIGVDATARAVKTEYDVLAKHYKAITVGRVKQNLAAIIVAQQEETAAEFANVKSALETAVDDATDFIRNGAGYMRFIYNANEELTEIVSLDDPDISQATNVWRWNNGGFGFSSTGYNGNYTLAITQNGAIVADFITAGTLNANVIRAGILQDALGKNSWNLDTGAFTITNGSINIDTAYSTTDVIRLNNTTTIGGQTMTFTSTYSPLGLHVTESQNGGTTYTTNINGGGIYMSNSAIPDANVMYLMNGTAYAIGGYRAFAVVGGVQKDRAVLTSSNYLQMYDSNDVLRQKADGNGKLWQYDANGKMRTYLEYGDIFLYNSSEKQTVHLGTYNNQHGYVYLYDGTSNTLRSWYDYTGLKFANASGTQIAGLTTSALTFYNSSGTKLNDFASYSVDNWIAGPPSPMVLSRTGIKVYRMGTFAIFTMEIYVTSGFTAGTWFPLCNICDNVGSLKGDFNAQIPDETGTSSFLLNIRGSDGEVSIYRYATSGNITGWLRACVPIMFEG